MDVVQRKSGFTLMELLIVIALIGILGSMAVTGSQRYSATANGAAAKQFLLEIASVQHQYFMANNGNGFASELILFGGDACSSSVGLIKGPDNVCTFYTFRSVPINSERTAVTLGAYPRAGMQSGNVSNLMIDRHGQRLSNCNGTPVVCSGPTW